MASGTIALTRTGSGYLTGQIVWSSTGNGSVENTSTVTAQLQIQRSALNATTGTFKGTFTVGSTSETISWYGTLPSNTWVTIKTITVTVSHNADGNGSCYLYALINGPTQTTMEGTYVSGSSTVTLDWIPRFASLVSVTAFTDEGNPVLTYSNPAGTSVDALKACISLNRSVDDIPYRDIPRTGTSYTFSLTEAERNTLRAATPKSNTLTVYIYIKSVIGGETDYSELPATMTIVNANPIVSYTVTDTNGATKALTGNSAILVAQQSTASVTINASAKKYATIASQRVEHGSAVLTGNGTLSPVTNHPIKFMVTDSRGNTATQNAANTIVPYINPTCGISNTTPDTNGNFELVVTGLFYNGSFGAANNTLTVQYRYGISGGSYGAWTTIGSVTKQGNSYRATANLSGLDYQTTYTFQARAIDKLNTNGVYSAQKAVVAKPVFDWGQNDFRFRVPVTMDKGAESVRLTAADDLNNIKANGWYEWASDNKPANIPTTSGTAYMACMRVTVNGGSCLQEVFDTSDANDTSGCCVQRVIYGSKVFEWEWVNPPMQIGAEYRTTERYNGKPVYVTRFSFGALPNATEKEISAKNGVETVLSASLDYNDGTNHFAGHPSAINKFWVRVTNGTLFLKLVTTDNRSAYNGYFTVKYTKA